MLREKKSSQGLTLVEILVALAIGGLLLSGIVQVFSSFGTSNRTANSLSRLQESARIAFAMMQYDARMAGYIGCIDARTPGLEDINFFTSNLQGFEVGSTSGWSGGVLTDIEGDAIEGSDVFLTQRASVASSALTTAMATPTSDIVTADNNIGIVDGQTVFIGNCSNIETVTIDSVTNGTGSVTFTHSGLDREYDEEAALRTIIENTYFVADTGRDTDRGDDIFALYRRSGNGTVDEVVEGVENMQIVYGQQQNGAGSILYTDASSITNPNNVITMKISLLIASNHRILEQADNFEYPMVSGKATRVGHASEGNVTFPDDRRLRQTFTTTVHLRNHFYQ